jgi:hypothetical protein
MAMEALCIVVIHEALAEMQKRLAHSQRWVKRRITKMPAQ